MTRKKAWFGFSLSTPWKTGGKEFLPVWPVIATSRGFYSEVRREETNEKPANTVEMKVQKKKAPQIPSSAKESHPNYDG